MYCDVCGEYTTTQLTITKQNSQSTLVMGAVCTNVLCTLALKDKFNRWGWKHTKQVLAAGHYSSSLS